MSCTSVEVNVGTRPQGVQLICTQAGAHNLFTIQPISSSAN